MTAGNVDWPVDTCERSDNNDGEQRGAYGFAQTYEQPGELPREYPGDAQVEQGRTKSEQRKRRVLALERNKAREAQRKQGGGGGGAAGDRRNPNHGHSVQQCQQQQQACTALLHAALCHRKRSILVSYLHEQCLRRAALSC